MFPAASPDQVGAPAAPAISRADAIAGIVVVLIYAAIQIVLALGHDPWLDEAQAWLLASRAQSPLDLIVLPGEGHPPLWYWILWSLSQFLDFSQARFLTLPIAILNAFLLLRLLRGQAILLAVLLMNFSILQFWGYHFRPYGLILTCTLTALLLDRNGRPVAATWAMAATCALHFFAGFLLAFWLLWQWHKGTPIRKLVLPALLALAFGLCAILSSTGNTTIGPVEDSTLFMSVFDNLGWFGMIPPVRGPIVAIITLVALAYGLRQTPFIAGALISLLVVFAISTALIYGRAPWHSTYLTMLCVMAFCLAGFTRQRALILTILLLPQAAFGAAALNLRFTYPVWAQDNLYGVIQADAGTDLVPERDVIGWPAEVIPPYSATYGIEMINGNNGKLIGPIDWSIYDLEPLDPVLIEKPGPYWLICVACQVPLDYLAEHGRTATLLGSKYLVDHASTFEAYRVQ